jgi:hypothetical protein
LQRIAEAKVADQEAEEAREQHELEMERIKHAGDELKKQEATKEETKEDTKETP